ncbi:FAD-dependent monooxygenase, partial [Crossiella equi]
GSRHQTLMVAQTEVEAELRRLFEELGGQVDWGHELVALGQDADGVTATLAGPGGPQTVRAEWLVGCDGACSAVRELGGFGFPGHEVASNFLLADVHLDWGLPRDSTAVWFSRDGVFAALPLPQPKLWRLVAPAPEGCPVPEDDVLGRLNELLPERTGYRGVHFAGATWTSVFPIDHHLADRYRRGRVLLAGDAAHVHGPMGAQGLSTGMNDADNLAWKLALVASGRASAELLDTYEAERRPVAQEVLSATEDATRLVLGNDRLTRFVRDHLLSPLLSLRPVRRRLAAFGEYPRVHYRRGPLARWLPGFGPRPGDRVRDLACHRLDGTPTRLHAELRGRWALLGRHEAVAPVVRELLGDDVVVLDRPGSEVWLVRPDAHLGWRGRPAPARLHRWLENVLRTGRAA